MISLACFIEEHREAVERDLLTEAGFELEDVGRSLSWRALKSFLSSAKPGSALSNELNPDMTEWSTTLKTNVLLADIFDQLSLVNANLHVLISRKKGKRPEPYKRPWMKERNDRHIGHGAMPVTDMREWIRKRQKAG